MTVIVCSSPFAADFPAKKDLHGLSAAFPIKQLGILHGFTMNYLHLQLISPKKGFSMDYPLLFPLNS